MSQSDPPRSGTRQIFNSKWSLWKYLLCQFGGRTTRTTPALRLANTQFPNKCTRHINWKNCSLYIYLQLFNIVRGGRICQSQWQYLDAAIQRVSWPIGMCPGWMQWGGSPDEKWIAMKKKTASVKRLISCYDKNWEDVALSSEKGVQVTKYVCTAQCVRVGCGSSPKWLACGLEL
jgi:hypothetical protein